MSETTKEAKAKEALPVDKKTLLKAWELMCTAKRMSEVYNENIQMTSKYVHATSRGHEAARHPVIRDHGKSDPDLDQLHGREPDQQRPVARTGEYQQRHPAQQGGQRVRTRA